jgi:hypothetical protein
VAPDNAVPNDNFNSGAMCCVKSEKKTQNYKWYSNKFEIIQQMYIFITLQEQANWQYCGQASGSFGGQFDKRVQ